MKWMISFRCAGCGKVIKCIDEEIPSMVWCGRCNKACTRQVMWNMTKLTRLDTL